MRKTLLSFVIPCYRGGETIERVINEIIETVAEREQYDYEIICVNDCSPDNEYEVIRGLAENNFKIKLVDFVRNMGKHTAVLAGYSFAKGDYVIDLDDDLQCPANEVWKLIEPLERDECDVATAKYAEKKESFVKRFGSNVNFRMGNVLLDKPKKIRMENFTAKKLFVCKEMAKYSGSYPYLEGLIYRVTKRIVMVDMEERERGDSKKTGFTFGKSLSLWLNGMTAFSVKPLRIASVSGCVFALIGFIWALIVVIRKLAHPEVPMGYSSIMPVILFSNGLIMLMLGLIGEYLGRTYISVNEYPQYVIRGTINMEQDRNDIF